MNRSLPVLQRVNAGDGEETYLFWCPGCEEHHAVVVQSQKPGPRWTWNGNLVLPTVSPSVLVNSRGPRRCHLFMHQGMLQFLPDCWHSLAGRTVDMIPLDEIFTEPPPPG